MACPCGGDTTVEDVSPILDITKIMQDWAWTLAMKRMGFKKTFMRRRDYIVDVPLNFYQFTDSETEFEDIGDSTLNGITSNSTSMKDAKTSVSRSLPKTSILSTQYENDTGSNQTYSFRMERARKAVMNVSYQKGFSVGGKANFTVGIAEGGIESRLEITKTTGQTFEETLTFETKSDIIVEANSNCTAQVVFSEKDVCKKFTVKTTMRMPSGKAPIFIKRKKDQETIHAFSIGDLRQIFSKYINRNQVEIISDGLEDGIKRYAIRFTTSGILEGVQLSGQTVKLHSEKRKGKGKAQTANEVIAEHHSREMDSKHV